LRLVVPADRAPGKVVVDARFAKYPRGEGIAVGAGEVVVAVAVGVAGGALEDALDALGLVAGPSRGDARGPAADAGVRRKEIAVDVADTAAAGVRPLPDFPAVRFVAVEDHEPVMGSEKAEHAGERGVA